MSLPTGYTKRYTLSKLHLPETRDVYFFRFASIGQLLLMELGRLCSERVQLSRNSGFLAIRCAFFDNTFTRGSIK